MSDSKKILALVIVIVGLGVLVFKSSQKKHETELPEVIMDHSDTEAGGGAETPTQHPAVAQNIIQATPATLPVVSAEAEALRQTPLNDQEIKSVSRLTSFFGKLSTAKTSSVQGVVNNIKALGLTPQKTIDENPYTGRLTIIRTANALQGTRYLHVQMPGINPKDEFVQHMSFQIRPGKDSFDKAVAMMQKSLPKGSKIQEQSSEFVKWSIEGGKEARVEILNTMDQLHSSKYDAVSKDDLGTVKVTVEIAIHETEGEHSDL